MVTFFKGFKLSKTFQIGKDFKGWQTHRVKTEVKFLPQAVGSQKSRVKQKPLEFLKLQPDNNINILKLQATVIQQKNSENPNNKQPHMPY